MPSRIGDSPAARPIQPSRPRPATPAASPASTSTQGWQPRLPVRRPVVAPPAPVVPRDFPKSADGTPIFKQGDADWGRRKLGDTVTISKSGCAMTASAMAMSKIRGEVYTPKDLDGWLDKNRGYSGDSLDWSRVGTSKKLVAELQRWSLDTVDANLLQGRPVVVGVDYKKGSNGGANGTDHWICVTGKTVGEDGKVTYQANDPGTGKVIELTPDKKGRLVSTSADARGKYTTSGQLRVFVDT
jgi:hypothetical protein